MKATHSAGIPQASGCEPSTFRLTSVPGKEKSGPRRLVLSVGPAEAYSIVNDAQDLGLRVDQNVTAYTLSKEIAGALRAAGHAPDGLVEAIELPDHPFGLAVQWHPEWLTDQESTRNLFRKFVEAAGE